MRPRLYVPLPGEPHKGKLKGNYSLPYTSASFLWRRAASLLKPLARNKHGRSGVFPKRDRDGSPPGGHLSSHTSGGPRVSVSALSPAGIDADAGGRPVLSPSPQENKVTDVDARQSS